MFLSDKKPHNTKHLAETYTNSYTLSHTTRESACEIMMLALPAKHLKSVARKGVGVRVSLPPPGIALSAGHHTNVTGHSRREDTESRHPERNRRLPPFPRWLPIGKLMTAATGARHEAPSQGDPSRFVDPRIATVS
jgi:hypothetical protein